MCRLEQVHEIINKDSNGDDLTDKNYQVVLGLLSREIKELKNSKDDSLPVDYVW